MFNRVLVILADTEELYDLMVGQVPCVAIGDSYYVIPYDCKEELEAFNISYKECDLVEVIKWLILTNWMNSMSFYKM